MGQAAALSGLIGLTGPLAIVLKPPPVTWLGLISANIGYFIYAPFLRSPGGATLEVLTRFAPQRADEFYNEFDFSDPSDESTDPVILSYGESVPTCEGIN